jgi:CheY-like chemotaxis protein
MIRHLKHLTIAFAASVACAPIARAQDESEEMPAEAPMDAPAEAPMDAPMDDAAPFGDAPAEAPADAAAAPALDAKKLGDDPAVQALLDSRPKTPAQLFRVAYYLTELGRADVADAFIKRFLASNPTPADLANILREHGSARLWRLARVEALGAEGKKAIDLVLNGARSYARDPAQISKAIEALGHSAVEVRRVAIHNLASAEDDAVAMLLAALADEAQKDRHPGIREALIALGQTSATGLAAAVTAPDDTVAIAAIDCLGQIRDRSAMIFLLGPACGEHAARRTAALAALKHIARREPTSAEARKLLESEAKAHLARTVRLPTHGEQQVTLWSWDAANRQATRKAYDHDVALAVIAARLASELAASDPNREDYRRLNIMAALEMSKLTAGIDAPLANPPKADAATLNAVLATALAERRLAAAAGAAEVLAKAGSPELLHRPDGEASTLVTAARDPDRRVRFAALSAIMEIGPDKPYAGSSSVLEGLCYFATADGRSRALVVDPHGFRAQTLAAFTEAIGFEGDAAIVGRNGRFMLNDSADYEFVLVDLGVDHPRVYELLGELRRDPRTARLPIGLMAGEGHLIRAKRLAAAFTLTIAFPQATDVETIEKQAGHLLAMHSREAVAADVRARQAELAVAWLAKIAGKNQAVYDLSRCEGVLLGALQSPTRSAAAAECLAHLGTHTAQRALVDLASQSSRPIHMRQTAAAAFAKSVPRRGIQLTSDEILEQYDRYNASRDLNEATQKVLSSILDAIESPREAAAVKKQQPAKAASLER